MILNLRRLAARKFFLSYTVLALKYLIVVATFVSVPKITDVWAASLLCLVISFRVVFRIFFAELSIDLYYNNFQG